MRIIFWLLIVTATVFTSAPPRAQSGSEQTPATQTVTTTVVTAPATVAAASAPSAASQGAATSSSATLNWGLTFLGAVAAFLIAAVVRTGMKKDIN